MNQAQPSIFFAHANGVPAPCYEEFFEHLAPWSVDYVPILQKHVARPQSWKPLADELIAAIEARHDRPVIGLGHSLGAVGIFWAARKRPELFERVIIMDPPLFGWQRRWLLAPFRWLGIGRKVVPPAKLAHKRRDHFAGRDEARAYWRDKSFFRPFSERSFEAYLQHGLTETAEGVTLTIPREQEEYLFGATPIRIGSTRLAVPGHFLHPTGRGILPPDHVAEIKRRFGSWKWLDVPGNHMFPLERPQETAQIVQGLLGSD